MSQTIEPRSLVRSSVLAWLNSSNCRSKGCCLSDEMPLRSADSCSRYSALTRRRISDNGTERRKQRWREGVTRRNEGGKRSDGREEGQKGRRGAVQRKLKPEQVDDSHK